MLPPHMWFHLHRPGCSNRGTCTPSEWGLSTTGSCQHQECRFDRPDHRYRRSGRTQSSAGSVTTAHTTSCSRTRPTPQPHSQCRNHSQPCSTPRTCNRRESEPWMTGSPSRTCRSDRPDRRYRHSARMRWSMCSRSRRRSRSGRHKRCCRPGSQRSRHRQTYRTNSQTCSRPASGWWSAELQNLRCRSGRQADQCHPPHRT